MSNYVRYTIVLLIVCLGSAGGVGGVYLLTKGPIARQSALAETEARTQVLPGAKFFEEIEEGSGVFAARTEQNGPVIGFIAIGETTRGYGGAIEVMVGLDPDSLQVVRAVMLNHNETPGLGAEMGKEKVSETIWSRIARIFTDAQAPPNEPSWVGGNVDGKSKDRLVVGKGVDAKTGCTITSKAVVAAARDAINKVEKSAKKTAK